VLCRIIESQVDKGDEQGTRNLVFSIYFYILRFSLPSTLKYQNDQASTKMDDAQDNPAGAFLLLEIILIIIIFKSRDDDDERPFFFYISFE